MARCNGLNKHSAPCGFPAPSGQRLCRNHHDPQQARDAAERASIAAKDARARRTAEMIDVAYSLHDRASIQAAIDATSRLHLAGRLSDSKARVQLAALRLAISNFDRPRETLEGFEQQSHDASAHYVRTLGYLETVEPVLNEAAELEMRQLEELAEKLGGPA